MLETTSLRLKTAIATLLAAIGFAALGAGAATAAPVNYQSGWRADNSSYGKGCNAKVFYGRAADGRAYAYGSSTNPACEIRVWVIPTSSQVLGVPTAISNWGKGTVGAATIRSMPSAVIWLDIRIPAFGSYISQNVWQMQ